jgi:hypothetical protein
MNKAEICLVISQHTPVTNASEEIVLLPGGKNVADERRRSLDRGNDLTRTGYRSVSAALQPARA